MLNAFSLESVERNSLTLVLRRNWRPVGLGALLAIFLTVLAKPIATSAYEIQTPPPEGNVFDLMSFGAVGDGVADDGPALQQALDAVAAAGGGTVLVPAGRYALVTPVSKDFAGLSAPVTIRGPL